MFTIPERTENFVYTAYNLETGEILECTESLSPIIKVIRHDIKIQHGNKIRTELLEHGVYYANGYGRNTRNENNYYSWVIYVNRW